MEKKKLSSSSKKLVRGIALKIEDENCKFTREEMEFLQRTARIVLAQEGIIDDNLRPPKPRRKRPRR